MPEDLNKNVILQDEDFIKAGYTKYPASSFTEYSPECIFQKCVKDEAGKKYFITVNKYAAIVHPYTGDMIGPNYEFTMQLSDKDTECPVNINLFGGWTIEDAEKRAELFWNMGVWEYYERWEE